MARKQTIDLILQTFKQLGGNLNEVMGTRTNINFLGKGKSPELMLDMDINTEALGVLPQSKAVEELTSSVGYAVSNKLNDIQANKLLDNLTKMKDFYIPPAGPANITDLRTGTTGLDKGGLESLRESELIKRFEAGQKTGKPAMKEVMQDDIRALQDDLPPGDPDLPPPGSRGEPGDVSAPFASAEETIQNLAKAEGVDAAETILPTGKGLEALKNVQNNNLIINDIVDKIYLNAGVAPAAQPVVRGNAREFLNRVKDLSDEIEGPTLSGVMEADDFKFMTEGGGGGMGDPFLLVQKYFGPKVAAAVAKLDGPNDIQLFAERLISVKDARGRGVTDRFFDPDTVDISDFEFADGGLARPGYFRGKLVGKALGMAMRKKALERGSGEGFAAAEAYGITGKDISRLFAELSQDKTLVGKEKTEYFKILNEALKNPDRYPEEILEIKKKLGIDIGLRSGGLAKILEV
jgi:hypothetical protein